MDSENPADNPNLDVVLADTAAVIADLPGEGRRVLLHCVAAEQRTLTMVYAAHTGTVTKVAGVVRRVVSVR